MSLFGYAWLGWNIITNPKNDPNPAMCFFKEVTHLPCPSCGTTRSLILLLRGDFLNAFMINPFGLIIGLALIVIPPWILVDLSRGKGSFYKFYINAENFLAGKRWVYVPAIIAVLLNWIWNITKGI